MDLKRHLRQMAEMYHGQTEDFDRRHCTGGFDRRGAAMPLGGQEASRIERHAISVRDTIHSAYLKPFGVSMDDFRVAIRAAAPRSKYDLDRLVERHRILSSTRIGTGGDFEQSEPYAVITDS